MPKPLTAAARLEVDAEIADVDTMLTLVREELDFRYPIAQQTAVMHRIGALLDQRAVLMRKRDGLAKGGGTAMNIETKTFGRTVEESIENHFVRTLDGRRGGVAEDAKATAENACEALGRLVNMLAERRQLTPADVVRLSGAYVDSVVFSDKP